MINFNGRNYNIIFGYKKNGKRWFALQNTENNKIYIMQLDFISFITDLSIYKLVNMAKEYKKEE